MRRPISAPIPAPVPIPARILAPSLDPIPAPIPARIPAPIPARIPDPIRAPIVRDEPGPLLFARYAYRPNELGYCGGDDPRSLFEHVRAGVVDRDLVRLDRGFEGAYPYLELIAGASGIADPLDRRVVEAYWIGNDLLERIEPGRFARDLTERFRARTPRGDWPWLVGKPATGSRPHHNFHVFEVLPRVGLLRSRHVPDVLEAMEQCSIRPARVVGSRGPDVFVAIRPLEYRAGMLGLGDPQIEAVRRSIQPSGSDGGFIDAAGPGSWVSVHWGWACDRLDQRQVRALERATAGALRLANETL